MAARDEIVAEAVAPVDQLIGETDDKKKRPAPRVTQRFVFDRQAVGSCLCHDAPSCSSIRLSDRPGDEVVRQSLEEHRVNDQEGLQSPN